MISWNQTGWAGFFFLTFNSKIILNGRETVYATEEHRELLYRRSSRSTGAHHGGYFCFFFFTSNGKIILNGREAVCVPQEHRKSLDQRPSIFTKTHRDRNIFFLLLTVKSSLKICRSQSIFYFTLKSEHKPVGCKIRDPQDQLEPKHSKR